MTNGSSQGLFVIVAVVIFGIFIGVSYILFKSEMKQTLASVFNISLTQALSKSELSEKEIVKIRDASGEENAFYISKFKGKLVLPTKLTRIERFIFELSEFDNEELIIPENVEYQIHK